MTDPVPSASHPPFASGSPVTEPMIHELVHAFYAKVRQDPVLGPIFGRVLAEADWPGHLAKLCDFWSAVTLRTGRFRGSPMHAHIQAGGIEPSHFGRWLQLFHETAEEVCPPAAAAVFVERSRLIGRNLQLGLQMAAGEMAPPRADGAVRP